MEILFIQLLGHGRDSDWSILGPPSWFCASTLVSRIEIEREGGCTSGFSFAALLLRRRPSMGVANGHCWHENALRWRLRFKKESLNTGENGGLTGRLEVHPSVSLGPSDFT